MEQIEQLPYFNKVSAGVALGKSGQNLDYWIKTHLKTGEIIALKKGLFVTRIYLLAENEKQKYYEYMANIIRYPSYLSLEYVLALWGLIPESVFSFTSITLKSSRSYANTLGNFLYKNIKEELFTGFRTIEYGDKKISIATKAKALFDFLYLKAFDTRQRMKTEILEELRINWDEFDKNDIQEFKNYVKLSKSSKMKGVVKILKW